MNVAIIFLILFGLLSVLFLFRKNTIPEFNEKGNYGKVSVIIPARNEESNLSVLLESLKNQTQQADEIIVVDDHSTDLTKRIAKSFGVKVLSAPSLPNGWTGKTWAVWNGYTASSGDILLFLDADIKLEKNALESLLAIRKKLSGVVSIVPFHTTKKFYEKLAMILNLLGIFTFTSPFEKRNKKHGLYGSCIIASRADYEMIGGHESIKEEMLDDLNLGAKFQSAGIRLTNFIGVGMVSFRMYPNGLISELQGFAKGAILSTSSISNRTLTFIVLWIIGLLLSQSFILFIFTPLFLPLFIGYIFYGLQIWYLNQYIGNFGFIFSLFHILSGIFFIVVIIYSFYQAVFRKKVIWKGRYIDVGRNEES